MTEPNPNSLPESNGLEQDDAIVTFLRTHTPPVPDPLPYAEEHLMETLQAQPLPQKRSVVRGKLRWMIGMGLLTTLMLGIGQWVRWLIPAPVPARELASLETFLIDNWDGSIQSGSELATEWNWVAQTPYSIKVANRVTDKSRPLNLEDFHHGSF